MSKQNTDPRLSRAIEMAEGTARSAPETGHTAGEVLEGNRDVFESMFGKAMTDRAFEVVLERSFEALS